jgi:hypothetical protein
VESIGEDKQVKRREIVDSSGGITYPCGLLILDVIKLSKSHLTEFFAWVQLNSVEQMVVIRLSRDTETVHAFRSNGYGFSMLLKVLVSICDNHAG